MNKKRNILIITDMEGSAGLTSEEQLSNGEGARALTLDIKAVVRSIRPLAHKIYIWDFDGNEDALKNEFGRNTKVISHPSLSYLTSLGIERIFLVGFHAMEGMKNEFCPHTYSGADIKKFTINGRPVGEATLFTHLFSQFKIPIVFVTGSYYACKELQTLGLVAETVPVRRGKNVYNVSSVRESMSKKAKRAMHTTGRIIKLKNYTLDITFHEPIAHFFKHTHFKIKSKNRIIGSSANFATLYREFVNGIFTHWEDPFRL